MAERERKGADRQLNERRTSLRVYSLFIPVGDLMSQELKTLECVFIFSLGTASVSVRILSIQSHIHKQTQHTHTPGFITEILMLCLSPK